jgi:hypothetical protein
VTTNNVAYCWGSDEFDQLGGGTRTELPRCNVFAEGTPCSTRPLRVVTASPSGR